MHGGLEGDGQHGLRSAATDGGNSAGTGDDDMSDEKTKTEIDDAVLPFCACGRRWSECDGSRKAVPARIEVAR